MMNRKEFMSASVMGLGLCAVNPISAASTNRKNSSVDPKVVRKEEGKVQSVMGDYQNLKLVGADTNGLFTLIEQHNEPGFGIPLHVHENEDEVFQVLSGQLEMTIGGKLTIMNAGDIIFCPRGISHSFKVIGNEKARVMLSIFPSGIENMFEELAALPSGPPDFEKVSKICGKYQIQFV
ncbi:cupin domain-containing protein [Flagellimonas sp.]|uniref:cupin domain-containing protein n=1 Tax=Flagellimonas sp. TaxID=2058762 RepID=UPI003B597D68